MEVKLIIKFFLLLFVNVIVFIGCKKKEESEPEIITTVPEVITSPVSGITPYSAKSGGNILNDGNTTITSRGLCYDTISIPDIHDNHIINGSGSGLFYSDMINLFPNTLYFIRAFATNNVGTSYGNEISFTTEVDTIGNLATLTTLIATSVTATNATSGGDITDDGGSPVITKGICYNTSPAPTLANLIISNGSGAGMYLSDLSNLLPNTLYFVRAYAVNNAGTAYGNEVSFTTEVQIPLSLIFLDSIRLLDSGDTSITYLPLDKKIEVTVTSDFTTMNMASNGKTLYAQDNTAGIQIRYTGAHSFAIGTKLEINVSGMELSTFQGLLQINNVPLVNATPIGATNISARLTTIADINTNFNLWESQLVKLNGITISGSGIYSGSNTLTDSTSNTIVLYNSFNATFASFSYPTGIVSVTGILIEYNGTKEITLRDATDVH